MLHQYINKRIAQCGKNYGTEELEGRKNGNFVQL